MALGASTHILQDIWKGVQRSDYRKNVSEKGSNGTLLFQITGKMYEPYDTRAHWVGCAGVLPHGVHAGGRWVGSTHIAATSCTVHTASSLGNSAHFCIWIGGYTWSSAHMELVNTSFDMGIRHRHTQSVGEPDYDTDCGQHTHGKKHNYWHTVALQGLVYLGIWTHFNWTGSISHSYGNSSNMLWRSSKAFSGTCQWWDVSL